MASYFGEVVFPSSRAFWDEYEGEDSAVDFQQEQNINITWLKDKPTYINKLILIEGEIISDFSRECLCHDSEEVCIIKDCYNAELATIFQINKDLYVCIITPTFDARLAGELVIKISDVLSNTKSIYLITWKHVLEYKNENVPTEPSFLRCLYTKNGFNLCKSHKELLKQPNIIHGVAAGVLSYAQMMELQSVLYCLYTDGFVLDSKVAEPLIEIFTEITEQTLHNINFVSESFFNKGNIYM